jgi:hypothetical protein
MQIVHLMLRFDHEFFNVLLLVIVDVVVVVVEIIQLLMHIYLVDKVEWVFVFEDKVALVDVCDCFNSSRNELICFSY